MSDNVLIFGAGASYDAGIPLMNGFVEKMWEFAIRGSARGEALDKADKVLLDEAMRIRWELDSYHGRAMFDDRNVEDILSLLSFNRMSGKRRTKHNMDTFVRAISRTIELACEVQHDGQFRFPYRGTHRYRDFWRWLVEWYRRSLSMPTIVTFNYDLVLERGLYQLFYNTIFNGIDKKPPFDGFALVYHYTHLDTVEHKIQGCTYPHGRIDQQGTSLLGEACESRPEIEMLKLHGSLNFSRQKPDTEVIVVRAVAEPVIMPPIFSKIDDAQSLNKIWSTALLRLRAAKNIVIVGYSLPRTDIYMQYFLKAALGPNTQLNRIFVFDPVLFQDNDFCRSMQDRYRECFSPQLQGKIVFKPPRADQFKANPQGNKPERRGTFEHLLDVLQYDAESVLF